MALQGCLDLSTGQAAIPPPGWAVHIGCSWRGCWFKPAHWQHFQQLDTESLKGGQDRTSPWSPHSMITAAEVGDEDVLWGKLLMTDM